ncbi:glycoside hydrolase family 16 protein [Methylobacterium sp. ARG-1]|uniref:glycoside hydrolase family 16 protein n=1 Tax=Methylobacterium sp. ARG-1 TaxID=1692501 RepID=UPI0009E7D284|nr:glycoside hydrolase family 16 protein [Methylobacterium sp. ARG-1]
MTSLNLTGYKLTFADEFNTRSISQTGAGTTWADIRSEWRFDTNSDIGFGHSSFVDPSSGYDPFKIHDGVLSITAVPDRTSSGYPGSWESGLLTTQGNFSQTYGYFEIRADFSAQPGAWDAFWLLPNHQTPDPNNAGGHQELDIVEHYGSYDQGVYSGIHTTDPQNGIPWQDNRQVFSNLPHPDGYHTFGMDWQADKISYYVDGSLIGSQSTPSDMHKPMYLLVNLATQGSGDNNSDIAGVPLTSHIDYVRAYSRNSDLSSPPLPQTPATGTSGGSTGGSGSESVNDLLHVTPGSTANYGFKFTEAQFDFKGGHDVMIAPDGTKTDLTSVGTLVFSDGSIHQSGNSPLVDDIYYYACNNDVWAAHLDSENHYNNYGWREGRNPNAYFDTNRYLEFNGDVAAAKINPLTQYDQYGWHEGRNPSSLFNTNAYLSANADVAAAHLDPLLHYLEWGAEEGRHLA